MHARIKADGRDKLSPAQERKARKIARWCVRHHAMAEIQVDGEFVADVDALSVVSDERATKRMALSRAGSVRVVWTSEVDYRTTRMAVPKVARAIFAEAARIRADWTPTK